MCRILRGYNENDRELLGDEIISPIPSIFIFDSPQIALCKICVKICKTSAFHKFQILYQNIHQMFII